MIDHSNIIRLDLASTECRETQACEALSRSSTSDRQSQSTEQTKQLKKAKQLKEHKHEKQLQVELHSASELELSVSFSLCVVAFLQSSQLSSDVAVIAAFHGDVEVHFFALGEKHFSSCKINTLISVSPYNFR